MSHCRVTRAINLEGFFDQEQVLIWLICRYVLLLLLPLLLLLLLLLLRLLWQRQQSTSAHFFGPLSLSLQHDKPLQSILCTSHLYSEGGRTLDKLCKWKHRNIVISEPFFTRIIPKNMKLNIVKLGRECDQNKINWQIGIMISAAKSAWFNKINQNQQTPLCFRHVQLRNQMRCLTKVVGFFSLGILDERKYHLGKIWINHQLVTNQPLVDCWL